MLVLVLASFFVMSGLLCLFVEVYSVPSYINCCLLVPTGLDGGVFVFLCLFSIIHSCMHSMYPPRLLLYVIFCSRGTILRSSYMHRHRLKIVFAGGGVLFFGCAFSSEFCCFVRGEPFAMFVKRSSPVDLETESWNVPGIGLYVLGVLVVR